MLQDGEDRGGAYAEYRLQKGETLGEVESSGGEGGEEEGADGSAEGSAPEEAR